MVGTRAIGFLVSHDDRMGLTAFLLGCVVVRRIFRAVVNVRTGNRRRSCVCIGGAVDRTRDAEREHDQRREESADCVQKASFTNPTALHASRLPDKRSNDAPYSGCAVITLRLHR